MRPLGWPFFLVSLVVCAALAWESLKMSVSGATLGFLLVLAVLGPIWPARLAVALVLRHSYKCRVPSARRFWGRFAFGLLLPGAVVATGATNAMPRMSFLLARAAMERVVADVRASEAARLPPATEPIRYTVRPVAQYDQVVPQYEPGADAVILMVKNSGIVWTSYGYVHSARAHVRPVLGRGFAVDRQMDEHWWSIHYSY
jgi:hypothetical protein